MRPKQLVHRDCRLTIRLFSLEKQAILLSASRSGLSVSDYLRKVGLGETIKPRLTAEELSLYQLLVDYRNNFSRISNLISNREDFSQALACLISSIDHHLRKFK